MLLEEATLWVLCFIITIVQKVWFNTLQTGEKYKVNSDRVKEQAAIDGAICKSIKLESFSVRSLITSLQPLGP